MIRQSNSQPHAGAWHSFPAEEDGATAVEYGLMAALLGLAIMGTISATGQAIKTSLYDQIGDTLASMSK
ncbi:MAG TPA: Flp family type IVb pilin [Xanthobacteraceae bacterium]|nr:Flp family type IVb pilin [Xanthobacteraceae bacterium]